ncbi:ferredoxin domain-containing protein [Desulfobulbus oligotrophicus]|uniref:Ferredoxin n=1 Tax=Desulfobulbus oligotrophicus TaxID=1909699 RepID=A0A7T6AR75_9BACT|nr:DUF2148 domain-containing protein [Desulfobulbus oligotrophicus]QQG66501.1 ferredoxin [Desulfobulbus oligotrophicus]
MKVVTEQEIREETVSAVAQQMMIAARTAPKAKGVDNLVIALLNRDDIARVSAKMKEMARRDNLSDVFLRDAVNILSAQAMVAFGTRIVPLGVHPCGMCGFADCEEKKKHPDHPCVFNTGDLGIAIGSAASVAMDNRVDNRVMFTVGQALLEMGVLGDGVKIIYAMPLSVSGKNPFMDRNQEALVKKA